MTTSEFTYPKDNSFPWTLIKDQQVKIRKGVQVRNTHSGTKPAGRTYSVTAHDVSGSDVVFAGNGGYWSYVSLNDIPELNEPEFDKYKIDQTAVRLIRTKMLNKIVDRATNDALFNLVYRLDINTHTLPERLREIYATATGDDKAVIDLLFEAIPLIKVLADRLG